MANLSTVAQGSERPLLVVPYTHADNTTGEDLTGAVITGYLKDLATGEVRQIVGGIEITDTANGVFEWTPDAQDVATAGTYQVQFSAVFGSEPTPGRTIVYEWEITESIIPTDPPTELPDVQGVVKLLARATDPDAAPTGYYGLFVKDGALWLIDDAGTLTAFDDGSIAAAAAVAAHVALADPHTQYLTEAAAASTYAPIGHNHDGTYAPASHTHAVTDVTDLGEYVQDTAAAMITGATHSNITVAYDDTAGTLAFTAGATYTDEMAQDAAASLLTAATHDGVSVSYDDAGATLAITNTDKGSSAVTSHLAAVNAHPEYLTQTEGDAAYAPISVTQYTDELAQDATAAALAAGTHTNITVTYNDAANTLSLAASAGYTDEQAQDAAASMLTGATHTGMSVAYNDAGNTLAITNTDGGAAAVSTHVGLADPHTQYLLESNANYVDLTDGGATTLHSHAVAWTDITDKPSIYQSTLFLHSTAADVATYKQALTVPSAAAEANVTAVASSGTGEVLLAAFITSQMGVSVINGNAWNFQTYAKVDSATGVSQIVVRVYKRDTGGTETELFNTSSAEINTTVATLFEIETVQSSFNVLPSDRMVIKYFAKTTSGSNRTLTLYYQGAENASHAATPVLFASLTVATDTIWDAKGDLAVGTANDTAAVLTVGTNDYVLMAASGEATGLKWAAIPDQGGIAESLIDAKGDLVVGSAADTPARLAVGASNGMLLTVASGEATGLKWAAPVRYLTLGRSGTLTATAGAARLYVPFTCTITNIRATVGTAPTGADLIIDCNKNDVTLFTTQGNRPTIAAGAYTDLTNTPDVTSIAANDYLTVDCDQIGATIPGSDLVVVIEVTA
jgi:YD repeat-containing protein